MTQQFWLILSDLEVIKQCLKIKRIQSGMLSSNLVSIWHIVLDTMSLYILKSTIVFMSCEHLCELSLEAANRLRPDHPDRNNLLQLPVKFYCLCPVTQQTHTNKAIYGEKPPITASQVPDFLLKVPRAMELFISHDIYEKALK